jgi:8-oxo-dGTP pyrophosphatase MutT (NUDIX family)
MTQISCGILVMNERRELLMGHVTGLRHWDIPKGIKDEGESPLVAALRETEEETGLRLQTAVLYAVSSLRGAGSTPATAFLTTFFNIRLGRWSPNPLGKNWDNSSPRWGFYWLLQELFGHSNETSDFVYLSDGGHFDNTGIYELVRRNCKTILAVDASQDFKRGYSDIANAIRLCRIDFGVEIDFDVAGFGLANLAEPAANGYVFGTIKYPDGTAGILILIKPTLISRVELGIDVFSYSRSNDDFPHQSTADQFFSESQFESYRALAERVTSACMEALRDKPDETPAVQELTAPQRVTRFRAAGRRGGR